MIMLGVLISVTCIVNIFLITEVQFKINDVQKQIKLIQSLLMTKRKTESFRGETITRDGDGKIIKTEIYEQR